MISDMLKSLREKRKLTRQQVADSIGIKKRALETYEYGDSLPSIETIKKFADFYNVTTDYLLEREPAPDPLELIKNIAKNSDIVVPVELYMNLPESARQSIIDCMVELSKAAENHVITESRKLGDIEDEFENQIAKKKDVI